MPKKLFAPTHLGDSPAPAFRLALQLPAISVSSLRKAIIASGLGVTLGISSLGCGSKVVIDGSGSGDTTTETTTESLPNLPDDFCKPLELIGCGDDSITRCVTCFPDDIGPFCKVDWCRSETCNYDNNPTFCGEWGNAEICGSKGYAYCKAAESNDKVEYGFCVPTPEDCFNQ